MYYSAGNFEAFAHPKKPEGLENKSAYIIGTGLAALSAPLRSISCAMRQMPGENIHVLRQGPGTRRRARWRVLLFPAEGYVMRGGREMDNHFEVMWDLSTARCPAHRRPEGVSVLDHYYWLNKEDPNYSQCRATKASSATMRTRRSRASSGSPTRRRMEILKLYLASGRRPRHDKPITDYFDDEVLNSNFWLYWRTMFAFENWHSALEMQLLHPPLHPSHRRPARLLRALRFTRYNQYESMILPMVKYLESHGVEFRYNTKVENVNSRLAAGAGPKREHTGVGQDTIQKIQATSGFFKRNPASTPTKKLAVRIDVDHEGDKSSIDLTENDLVFITNGGLRGERPPMGAQNTPAGIEPRRSSPVRRLGHVEPHRRPVDPSFGHPEKFIYDPNLTKWMSATATTLDDTIPAYIEKITGRSPFGGHTVTGGIVTVEDSNWLMSWTVNRQQQFRNQPKDMISAWIYGLFPDKPGNYIRKPMQDCTGMEICEEWLYHMGVPEEQIEELAKNHCNTVPVMMPYVDAFFMPRELGDRPDVVPDGAVNFAFIGQFAEEPRDTIFTTEYSMRTGMEAVYTLCDVDRGVPEVWNSEYDVRDMLNAAVKLRDGQPLTTFGRNNVERKAIAFALGRTRGTYIYDMLKVYGAIADPKHPVDMKPGMRFDESFNEADEQRLMQHAKEAEAEAFATPCSADAPVAADTVDTVDTVAPAAAPDGALEPGENDSAK